MLPYIIVGSSILVLIGNERILEGYGDINILCPELHLLCNTMDAAPMPQFDITLNLAPLYNSLGLFIPPAFTTLPYNFIHMWPHTKCCFFTILLALEALVALGLP